MLQFFATRLIGLAGVLLAMTFIIFTLQQLIPADPARAAVGLNAPRATVEAKRIEMHLDRPMLWRYGRYLVGLAEGDLGQSSHTHNPVARDLARFLPASVELVVAALLLGVALGLVIALPQALGWRVGALRIGLIALSSPPIFLTGLLLVLLFWYQLGWLPASGRATLGVAAPGATGFLVFDALIHGHIFRLGDTLAHLVLPALTLALPVAVAIGRTLDSSLAAVMRQPFIRTARAKGLTDGAVLRRHGLRNAANAPLTMLGLQLPLIFSNLLIVERLFAWPGLGLYVVQAFAADDLPAILGVALAFAAFYIVFTLLIDLLQAAIDPRIGLS